MNNGELAVAIESTLQLIKRVPAGMPEVFAMYKTHLSNLLKEQHNRASITVTLESTHPTPYNTEHLKRLLDKHGVCIQCGDMYSHDIAEPLASCSCGHVSEWTQLTPYMQLEKTIFELSKSQSGDHSPDYYKEHSRAWLAVCDALTTAYPGWEDKADNGLEAAVNTILAMAGKADPTPAPQPEPDIKHIMYKGMITGPEPKLIPIYGDVNQQFELYPNKCSLEDFKSVGWNEGLLVAAGLGKWTPEVVKAPQPVKTFWDNAPEGATHYHNHHGYFYKQTDDGWFYWNSGKGAGWLTPNVTPDLDLMISKEPPQPKPGTLPVPVEWSHCADATHYDPLWGGRFYNLTDDGWYEWALGLWHPYTMHDLVFNRLIVKPGVQ